MNELTPFENKAIRKVWHLEQWYFSIVDIIEVLTESSQPSAYWNKVKKQIQKESEVLPFWQKVKLKGLDGKTYPTDCANVENVFRLIMSVPSPKAEPLKLWLAEQGKRTLDETENPELLTERQAELYRAKGYPDDWILKRVQSIKTRKELTDEWKKRGVTESKEFSILTATIAKGTFGLNPSEHKELKGIKPNDELRDNMTAFELIFTALSEEATKQFAINEDATTFEENHEAAEKGGKGAGIALKNFEQATGLKVVSDKNFKNLKSGEADSLSTTTEPKE